MLTRHGTPLRSRLRTSFWTSTAVCSVLLAVHECQQLSGWREPTGTPTLRGAASAESLADAEAGDGFRRLETELYPEDLLLSRPYKKDPKRGLVFLHVIGIGYMLLGLNTVCDVYFTGALEEMVTNWKIKPDVAGATFMAAGGSAPEFFTSLIGTTIAMNDVGFSTIVGSAVFNVLFVIGLCGYVAKEAIDLSWWPLFRDCSYYIIGLSMLALFAADEKIALWEAVVLFCAYLVYCTIMYFNERLEGLVSRQAKVAPDVTVKDASGAEATSIGKADMEVKDITKEDLSPAPRFDPEATPEKEVSDGTTISTRASPDPSGVSSADALAKKEEVPEAEAEAPDTEKDAAATNGDEAADAEEEEEDDDDGDFMEKPEGGMELAMWYASLPIYLPLYYLTPEPGGENWTFPVPKFVFCFLVSLAWIAGFSFLLVWWVEILGDVCHVDEIIMGFTILAAGTSIPDAVSSMAVARNGEGDMAVSSSIGSNIFDILIGLPVPWMIKTGIIEGGGYEVKMKSPYLAFYVILLLCMVFSTIVSIHCIGWKLNKTLGVAMAVLYCLFLAIALTVEFTTPEALKI